MTFQDAVLIPALFEIRAARAGDVPSPDDITFVLNTFNAMLDEWNAERKTVYAETINDFTLTPSLSPHTIGPGPPAATFVVTQRPVKVDACSIGLNNISPIVYTPVHVRDWEWYSSQPTPTITNTLPRDVYYDPAWPNGNLYFYGVPTTAYAVRLWLRLLLASVAATDTFALPPGYQNALMLSLAERIAVPFGQQLAATTERNARKARERVFGNNDAVPYIQTRDAGIPTGDSGKKSSFNYRDRQWH